MGLLRSKRTFGQANTQEPARRRARTARASNESNSLVPTNSDSLREHNTINLDSFFARMRSIFPHLSSVTVLVDYLEHPNSSLFEIGSDLMDCNRVTKVTFDAVGSLVADTIFGFTIRVKHQWLARNWQRGMATPLDPTRKWLRRPRAAICISLFESKKILESARTNTLAERWHHGLQEQIMSVDREM
jgi:hypothetical protein